MSARVRGWLATAVAALLLAGLTLVARTPVVLPGDPVGAPATLVAGRPSPPDPDTAEPDRPESAARGVQQMLDRRAAAIFARDEPAFLATLDPRADPAFFAAQRSLFGNLAGVPLAQWSYHVDGSALFALPDHVAGDRDERYAPRTTLRYALRQVDQVPTERPLAYLYVRRAGRWLLSSDTALGPSAGRTWRGPWDFGPCTAVTTPAGGLVLGHSGHEEMLGVLAGELDGAVREVTQVWGDDWSQRAAVLLPSGDEEFRALVGPSFATTGIAAAATADRVDIPSRTVAGQRVVFNPAEAGKLSASALRVVLRHELTHLATRASTVDGSPMWLLEGFADYVGYRASGLTPREAAPDLARAVSAGTLPAAVPSDADFRDASGRLDTAYQLAWSLSLYVAERAGEPGLVRLYRQVAGDAHLNPSTVDAIVDAALGDVLGTDLAGLVESWRQWLPSKFG